MSPRSSVPVAVFRMRALRITRSAGARPVPWSIRCPARDPIGSMPGTMLRPGCAIGARQSRLDVSLRPARAKLAEVDVRAAHQDADAAAGEPIAQRAEQRRGRCRASRLQRQLQRVERQAHRVDHGGILDAHDLVHEAAAQTEAVGQRVGCAQAVGDGRDPLESLRAAGGHAAPHAVGPERLDAEDEAARAAAA